MSHNISLKTNLSQRPTYVEVGPLMTTRFGGLDEVQQWNRS